MYIFKNKTDKNPLNIRFQLFIFYKADCLQKHFDEQVLSIRAFSSDGHHELIVGSLSNDDDDAEDDA